MNPSSPGDEAIFRHAAAISSPLDRDAYLVEACAGNTAMLQRIRELLLIRAQTEATPEPSVPAGNFAKAGATEKAGDKIDRYRLIEVIGEGGCGVVYLAEQEEPVRRQVALKIIKLGMDTRQVVSRFEAERQALAMMDHPNIAHVLDGGATESGRPYFVMEMVHGTSITKFCDEHRLTPRERIEMFIKVCQAIQHAHQKGIIHRDIKPTNVLVTMHDGTPVPKVIDFGIAKAMGPGSPGESALTTYHAFVGTPAYASPEQIGAGSDVDTRSDVYSLGVVLYELLTGCPPFDAKKLGEGGFFFTCRMICEVDPPRPSTRLSALDQAERVEISRRRQINVDRLIPLMRGDLDWIVMKCLEKKRAHRYETANGLAADLRRYLQEEPVTARPPSRGYILQKLVRRHRLAFTAGSVVAATLIAGFTVATDLYFRERRALRELEYSQKESQASAKRADANAAKAKTEAEKSREVSAFMKEMMESVGPVAVASESAAWRQVMDQAAERIRREHLHPAVEWELRTTLGEVYASLAQRRQAIEMHREALRLARQNPELAPVKVIDSLVNLGWLLKESGQAPAADPLLQEALKLGLQTYPPDHPRLTWIKGRLGWNLMALQRLDEAEPLCREALEQAREYWGRPGATLEELPASLSSFATALAYVLQLRGNKVEAEALFREALEAARSARGDDDPEIKGWIFNLAAFLRGEGRRDEAETLYRKAWELVKAHAPKHPGQIASASNLALLLRQRHADTEADQVITQLLSAAKGLPESDHPTWANNLASVGAVAASHGYLNDSVEILRTAAGIGSDNERIPAWLMAIAWRRNDGPALREAGEDFLGRLDKRGRAGRAMDTFAALVFQPATDTNPASLQRLASQAGQEADDPARWGLATRALAEYRLGRFDSASKLAQKVTASSEPELRIAGNVLVALCHQRSGRPKEARDSLTAGKGFFSTWAGPQPGEADGKWFERMIAQALLQEAQTSIGGSGVTRTE